MKKQILTAMLLCSSILVRAQSKDWQHLDLEKDKVFGISADKTYEELLKGHKAKTVIVAILDGGADTSHIDLKPVLWVNPKEKAGSGKDDDHNGYADDVHGWNFIGGPQGNVNYDNLELVRLIRRGGGKNHPEMQEDYDRQLKNAQNSLAGVTTFKNILDTIVASINKPAPAFADFKAYSPESLGQANVRQVMLNVLKKSNLAEFLQNEIGVAISHFQTLVSYQLNPAFDPRSIVGDNYNDDKQRFYGNNNVTGPNALHGSHVAGIVGADRSDTTGIKGIADHVKLMIVRVVPDGDERDKDIANGIRYAADNGASIINMSFGKPYSWDKPAVDAAVKYAISKDILLVQGAGNSAQNTDSTANFPNRVYADGSGTAGAWINVGASGWVNDTTLCASFSNYGLNTVDVFAPGERIYSTVPGSGYQRLDGTSMAAPVVAGLAALIREYYPKLTAVQVKDIILRSVVKIDHNVTINKNGKPLSVPFSSLCKSGGIINAYNALQLASSYK